MSCRQRTFGLKHLYFDQVWETVDGGVEIAFPTQLEFPIKNPKPLDLSGLNANILETSNGQIDTSSNVIQSMLTALQSIKKGDYFIAQDPTQPVNDHGALIVGWGPAQSCSSVIAQEDTGNPYEIGSNWGNNQVPYIADYNFGGTSLIGYTQDQRPRPFYCVKVQDNNLTQAKPSNTRFSGTRWRFFHLPDRMFIPEFKRYTQSR